MHLLYILKVHAWHLSFQLQNPFLLRKGYNKKNSQGDEVLGPSYNSERPVFIQLALEGAAHRDLTTSLKSPEVCPGDITPFHLSGHSVQI